MKPFRPESQRTRKKPNAPNLRNYSSLHPDDGHPDDDGFLPQPFFPFETILPKDLPLPPPECDPFPGGTAFPTFPETAGLLQLPPTDFPEDSRALVFLMVLLDLAGADCSQGQLTVRWGDDSPPEIFDLETDAVNGDHTHSYAEDGYYDVVLALTRSPDRIELWRFTLQISNLSEEIDYFRPADTA